MLTSLFNTAMGPVGLLCSVSALAIAGFAARRFSRRDTKFASVHPGKREVGGCKFDEEEVRKTRFAPTPPIDISNLPAPDPRMVAAFKTINPADLRTKIEMISGETDLTVGGKKVRVKSRSTHRQGYLTVMQWLEEFYASIGLPTKRLSYKKGGKTFYYLVATKQGSSKRKLIVGAHIDSTAGEQYRDEPVAPGADDDGSGTIGLMEYARILAPLDLTHTVELVHFSGEEQGLWASYAYSDIVAAAKTDLIAMLETDMIGYCAKPGNRVDIHDDADKNGSHKLVVMMVRNVARYALNLNPVDTHNHAVEDRSDHAGFLDHGYMGVLVSEEFTDDGFNPRYHSSDERSKYMNFEYMAEVIKMVLATIVDLAEVK